MTRLTERYLRNYLAKKALTMAAAQEIEEAKLAVTETRLLGVHLSGAVVRQRALRQRYAIAMHQELQQEEQAAFRAYLDQLQSESCDRSS